MFHGERWSAFFIQKAAPIRFYERFLINSDEPLGDEERMESFKEHAHRFFVPGQNLSQASSAAALRAGHVLLVSRCAFSSETETRESYPPKRGEEDAWRENARPWYEERRHLFVACINPMTQKIITSSAEPDKAHTPWTLGFCTEDMPLTQLDVNVLSSPELWDRYSVSTIVLSREDYASEKVADIIQKFRENRSPLVYSIDPERGYDCQTATRDVLWAANLEIDPKTLMLPEATKVLAYYSVEALNIEENLGLASTFAVPF